MRIQNKPHWKKTVKWTLIASTVFSLLAMNVLMAEPISGEQAVGLLRARVQKDHLYASLPVACMSFAVEEQQPSYIEIAIREKHGGSCPGDPGTAPILDRFRMDRNTKEITWYNVLDDDYRPYEDLLRERLK